MLKYIHEGGFEMEKKYLTLEQNLCSARVFLNIFNLILENKEDINEFTKFGIFDRNNNQVGTLYFENDVVKIQSATSLGNLNANYDIAQFSGFRDLECGGAFVQWNHEIKFKVDGNQSFSGDMQLDVSMDTNFGNTCRFHTKIKYIDKDNKEVELKFMDDGKPFSYEAKKEGFREVLEIDPWSDFESFMYHIIRKGEYDTTHHCFPNDSIKFVWHNGINDKKHLKTVSHVVENLQTREHENQLYDSVGKDDSVESTIQKGLLMQKIDPDFSKKIIELINYFKKDNVSFFENLIDVSFNKVSEEERKALFGTDIERISYNNGADNLLDAYFGIQENNHFLPTEIYTKVLK